MTPQERDLITTLLDRLKSAATQPKDPEADALIRQAVAQQPDMPYYLVQTVLIQDLALHSAQDRIADLERQLAEAKQSAGGGSFLGKLFGSSQPASPPPAASSGPWSRGPQTAPPQQPGPGYPQGGYGPGGGYGQPGPGYAPQPGYGAAGGAMGGMGNMLGGGSGGGGFLRSAAATAAGVAGGALLFQGISSMFGHGYANTLSGGMSPGLGETVINNYYGDSGSGAGGDYGGGSDPGYSGGGSDYSGSDYGGGGDSGSDYGGGGDFGGGGDPSC